LKIINQLLSETKLAIRTPFMNAILSPVHHSASQHPPAASIERLKELVKDDLELVNQRIIEQIDQNVPLIRSISEHIIRSGGKRLRPTLVITCAKLCEYQGDRHINLAAAVEFIHTATLLHDDVVDESTLRRGSQTANAVWSNQASVLVGDFLLSRSFQLMVADGSLDVLRLLSDASATISRGEVKQLMASCDLNTDEALYLEIIRAKTATLFSAACAIGGFITQKPKKYTDALITYGDCLGIAFQLVDDALDYASDQQTLGKEIGDDFREGKITLPIILAYEQGTKEEKAFWQRAIESENQSDRDLHEALRIIAKYDTVSQSLKRAESYVQKGVEALSVFPESEAKLALCEAIHFSMKRAY
jgi:octaprenyl-diphosphate synthase